MLPNDCIEQWRAVEGWPGYEVSDMGRVRSWRSQGRRAAITNSWKIMSTGEQKYKEVRLRAPGRTVKIRVHVLVLLTFVGPPADGQEVRHLDDCKHNNKLSNLCWGTRCENTDDKRRNNRIPQGEKHYAAKLTDADVVAIRERANKGESYGSISKDYPQTCEASIGYAASGRTFKHLPNAAAFRESRKVTNEQVSDIRRLYASGVTQTALAAQFGLGQSHVSRIIRGESR